VQTVYKRVAKWAQLSVWDKLLEELEKSPDSESISIDASYVKLHQHGTGAKGGISHKRSGEVSDRAYDAERLIHLAESQGSKIVVPPKNNMIGIFIKNDIWLNVFLLNTKYSAGFHHVMKNWLKSIGRLF
jgi:hypothetical protein